LGSLVDCTCAPHAYQLFVLDEVFCVVEEVPRVIKRCIAPREELAGIVFGETAPSSYAFSLPFV
jgi:hypothetical protein